MDEQDVKRKRRRLTDISVKAISLVSLGANQPARVLLYKSAEDEPVSLSADELRSRIAKTEAETAALKARTETAAQERDEAVYELSILSPTTDRAKDRADAEREYEEMIRRTRLTYPTLSREQAAELVLRTVAGQLVYDRLR